jgi:hypothetical protein
MDGQRGGQGGGMISWLCSVTETERRARARERKREGERVRMRRLGVCGEVVAVHHPGSDRFGGRAWVA